MITGGVGKDREILSDAAGSITIVRVVYDNSPLAKPKVRSIYGFVTSNDVDFVDSFA
jgi:hypothetical protein